MCGQYYLIKFFLLNVLKIDYSETPEPGHLFSDWIRFPFRVRAKFGSFAIAVK